MPSAYVKSDSTRGRNFQIYFHSGILKCFCQVLVYRSEKYKENLNNKNKHFIQGIQIYGSDPTEWMYCFPLSALS